MQPTNRKTLATLLVLILSAGIVACGEQKSAEEMGKKVDETMTDAGNAIEDTAEDVSNKVDETMTDAGNAIEDAAEDVSDKVDEAVTDTGNAIEDKCEEMKESMNAEDPDC